ERCAHGVQTMNGRFECVDPIEHPLDRMPARNLAEDVLGVRDTCNFDHDGPRLISCPACEELRQAALLELASGCQRQLSFADELHHAGNLVGRKLAAAKRQKVGFLDALSRLAHDERSDYLVALRVRNAGNACKLDGRMRHQHLFDLDWSNIDATSLDHFLDAPAKIQSPLSIEEAKIAGDEVAARIEGGAILFRILVIADRYIALDANLADLTLR